MDTKKEEKPQESEFHCYHEVNMRTILHNAIRMQALYSGKKIKIIEASRMTN